MDTQMYQEDAVRQCKTITEDAMQIMGKLQSMSGEEITYLVDKQTCSCI